MNVGWFESLLWALALLLAACAKPGGEATTAPQPSTSVGDPASCGERLEAFNQTLAAANQCRVDADCDFLEVSVAGCWTLFNRERRAELMDLNRQASQPRCRVFLPLFKCAPRPGEPVCQQRRCVWSK